MDLSADLPQRSIHPADYQKLPRPIAAMAKKFAPHFEIAPHEHTRDQLLYAASGYAYPNRCRSPGPPLPDRAGQIDRLQRVTRTVFVAISKNAHPLHHAGHDFRHDGATRRN